MKTKTSLLIVLVSLCILSCKIDNEQDSAAKIDMSMLPFEMEQVKLPLIPSAQFDITDYGAIPDGMTNNKRAIERAISESSDKGGGKVIIPKGTWLTGPIRLKSNINLYLENGALLIFSSDFDDYPLEKSKYGSNGGIRCQPPISGTDLENIAITGEGIIDGSGDAWRPVKQFKMTERQWNKLIKSGGVLNEEGIIWYPSEKALEGSKVKDWTSFKELEDYERIKDFYRPRLLSLQNCKRILLEGVTFQNSPSWCLHPLLCEDITIRNITVRNPWYSQNGDGLDLESCRNGIVERCSFDVGDDAICIKSGKDKEGRDRNAPSENFVISNCIVYHGHGGFVIGSEMSSGVRNFYVSNCTFIGTDIGLRFKSTRGRGGVVENIYIDDIRMADIATTAIHFTTYYEGKGPTEDDGDIDKAFVIPEVTEETPIFRNFKISNIVCNGAEQAIGVFGLPEMSIHTVEFTNLTMRTKLGVDLLYADSITFDSLTLEIIHPPLFYIQDSKSIVVDKFNRGKIVDNLIMIAGKTTDNINVNRKAIPVN